MSRSNSWYSTCYSNLSIQNRSIRHPHQYNEKSISFKFVTPRYQKDLTLFQTSSVLKQINMIRMNSDKCMLRQAKNFN